MITPRRSLFVAALVATSLFSSQVVHAAVIHVPNPTHAMFANSNSKPVQFSVRNDCSSTLELKAGDQTITVEAGQTVKVKIPAGTKLITTKPTTHSEAGSVVVEVTDSLNGATVAVS